MSAPLLQPLLPLGRRFRRAGGRWFAAGWLLAVCGLLGACGFHLRGSLEIPFATLHVAVPDHSEFGTNLKRAIRAQRNTKLVDTPAAAQAILTPTGEAREKTILSLNSAGRVREFQLRYRYSFRVHDPKGQDLMAPAVVILTRDLSFDDAAVLAKEQEEGLLWRDMESDLVHQILRRLANAKRGPGDGPLDGGSDGTKPPAL